jgi:hypothetical protein
MKTTVQSAQTLFNVLAAAVAVLSAAGTGGCTTFSDLQADANPATSELVCASGGAGCTPAAAAAAAAAAAPPDDHAKNGAETDVDCGGPTAPACADGKACKEAHDCTSGVCKSAVCDAPRPDDGVKNADETDIDCGGAAAPKCAVGKACTAHGDCTTDGCGYDGKCAIHPSCTAHFGGDTCGSGEVDAPGAKHESCCTSLPVDRPADKGGPYVLDKYLITAGRMRAFIERFKGNLRAQFANATPPDTYPTWLDDLPTDQDSAYESLGPNADERRGCRVSDGTRTYWAPDAVSVAQGDIPEHYSKDILDQKVQNCTPGAIFYAFCMWDGGQLASSDEILYAWHGPDNRTYPWGNDPAPSVDFDKANVEQYGHYAFPGDTLDNAAYMSAPGRMTGNGQFGHADLIGPVLNIVRDQGLGLLYTGSLEGHGYTGTVTPNWGSTKALNFGAYGMAGARCARPTK